jgi:pimeloyl-ACP methyl ester carboxylesterase
MTATGPSPVGTLQSVGARVLEVAYYQAGPADGPPMLLRHGFPYDTTAARP